MDETQIKEKLKQGYLRTKLIIEIAGFPEEHVNHTLNLIKEKLLELNGVESVKTKIREAKRVTQLAQTLCGYISLLARLIQG